MIYAYFNECLPHNLSLSNYVGALAKTAVGMKILHENYADYENMLGGIITVSEKSQYLLGDNVITLEQCIKEIDDRDMRNLLMSWMVNYPVSAFFTANVDEETILNEDYSITFSDGSKHDALNLVLAKYNGNFLFSLNLDKALGENEIEVNGNSAEVRVANLYGCETSNIDFINNIITSAYRRTLDTDQQIESILQKTIRHSTYDAEYSRLSSTEQNAILDTWKDAESKCLLNPFRPDNDIIKKTEGPEKKEKQYGPVYELRVRKPREIRIYFQYVDDTYYLLDIKDKTHQSIDIKNAFVKAGIIRKLK